VGRALGPLIGRWSDRACRSALPLMPVLGHGGASAKNDWRVPQDQSHLMLCVRLPSGPRQLHPKRTRLLPRGGFGALQLARDHACLCLLSHHGLQHLDVFFGPGESRLSFLHDRSLHFCFGILPRQHRQAARVGYRRRAHSAVLFAVAVLIGCGKLQDGDHVRICADDRRWRLHCCGPPIAGSQRDRLPNVLPRPLHGRRDSGVIIIREGAS
jgi:hypothetical protein